MTEREKPPGGSGFGGFFDKDAFSGSIYPKPGARKVERSEFQATTVDDTIQHMVSSIGFTRQHEDSVPVGAYDIRPSRLRRNYDLQAGRLGKMSRMEKMKSMSAGALSAPGAASDMALQMIEEEKIKEIKRIRETRPGSEEYEEILRKKKLYAQDRKAREEEQHGDLAKKMNLNTWYPHPVHLRGTLKLSQPAALAQGIDPLKDKGHECPFWDAPKHRFAAVAAMPEARPRTPLKSIKWKSDLDWQNPLNHSSIKITHRMPGLTFNESRASLP